MTKQYIVWATQSKSRNRDQTYSYRFRYGSRPTKTSFQVGTLDLMYNPETGEDTEYVYHDNGHWLQPSYFQVLSMEASINN